jgi:hypothetical protein
MRQIKNHPDLFTKTPLTAEQKAALDLVANPQPPDGFDDDSGDWVWFDPVEGKWVTTRRLDQVRHWLKNELDDALDQDALRGDQDERFPF